MNFIALINYMQSLSKFIMTDKFGFWFFEILLFSIFLYALWKDKICPKNSIVSSIIKVEESRKVFITSARAFVTFVVSVIFIISPHPEGGRILLYLVNLSIVVYLFFCSGWFTNKLIGLWVRFKQQNFNLHE